MAKKGFSHAALQETRYLRKKPHAEVREQSKRGVEFPGHNKGKAAIQRHLAMLCQNQTFGCLPCQNGSAKNPQTRCRRKGTNAPPPARRGERIPEPTAPPPGTLPASTGNTSGAQPASIINLPAGYTYSHTAVRSAEYFEDDQVTEHDTDFDTDMLTDEG